MPDSPGAAYTAHEVDHTIMNPGDHWFWREDHPYLSASDLFQHWLSTVGQGSNYILNVPPDTSGSIPQNFAAEVARFGAALNASFDVPVAAADKVGDMYCDPGNRSYATLSVPPGMYVTALTWSQNTTSHHAPTHTQAHMQSCTHAVVHTCSRAHAHYTARIYVFTHVRMHTHVLICTCRGRTHIRKALGDL